MTTSKDISACLTNCSGNGVCALDSNYNFYCACAEFYTGKTCDKDIRPCSAWPCLWNGNCTNLMNGTAPSFVCSCPYPYYGRNCQLKINLCQNSTCVPKQGSCKVNGTTPYCDCFIGFSGDNCQILSSQLQTAKTVSNVTGVLAAATIVSFFGIFIFMDITKYGSAIIEIIKLLIPTSPAVNPAPIPTPAANANNIIITDID